MKNSFKEKDIGAGYSVHNADKFKSIFSLRKKVNNLSIYHL